MTPNDLEDANRQLLTDLEKGRDQRAASDPVHAEFQRHIDALRALLLDYQERGRALEFVRGEARRGQTVRPGDACLVLIEARARASLKATDTGREG